jgi:hypothetical protein
MKFLVDIPDDVVAQLADKGQDLSRASRPVTTSTAF